MERNKHKDLEKTYQLIFPWKTITSTRYYTLSDKNTLTMPTTNKIFGQTK